MFVCVYQHLQFSQCISSSYSSALFSGTDATKEFRYASNISPHCSVQYIAMQWQLHLISSLQVWCVFFLFKTNISFHLLVEELCCTWFLYWLLNETFYLKMPLGYVYLLRKQGLFFCAVYRLLVLKQSSGRRARRASRLWSNLYVQNMLMLW